MDFFEKLLDRDLNYPKYMDWSVLSEKNDTTFYQHPKNVNRVVMVQRMVLNENSIKKVFHTAITYYYGSKIHRLTGPAQIAVSEFIENNKKYRNFEISWNNKGLKVRKDGPAVYLFRTDEFNNIKINTLKWGVLLKNRKRTSVFHKLNGPAYYTKDAYAFYLEGIAIKEYTYWKTLMTYYPKAMPKILKEDGTKIVFDYSENKPAPQVLYKNINRIVYVLKENNIFNVVDKETYWKKTYERLAIKNNWLITE